jgi:hypothetical protein
MRHGAASMGNWIPTFEGNTVPSEHQHISRVQNLQLHHYKNTATCSHFNSLQTFIYTHIHQTHVRLRLNGSGG